MQNIIAVLRYVNSVPFPLTVNHYVDFGQSNKQLVGDEIFSPESWDSLREGHAHFSVSSDREEWLAAAEGRIKKDGQDGGMPERAKAIAALLNEYDAQELFSVGVGGAGIEYQIKKIIPNLHLVCSEFSRVNVKRLQNVFTECDEIIVFDMIKDDWSLAKGAVLLNHVDIEMTDDNLHKIFKKMHAEGITLVLFICCRITLKSVVARYLQRVYGRFRGSKYSFAGTLRSKKAFPKFWSGLYDSVEIETPLMSGFLLQRISKS